MVIRPFLLAIVVTYSILLSPMSSQQDLVEPSVETRFEILYDSLNRISQEYVNDALKTIAFLLLTIGWVVTSERCRAFLRENRAARSVALAAIPLIAVIQIVQAYVRFAASQRIMGLLGDLNYLHLEYYADAQIMPVMLVTRVALHIALFGTLFALVCTLQRGET